jgi:uncharacterized protein
MKFLNARWEQLIMANYLIDSSILEKYVPFGTELDLQNGKACVSLVGFMFKRIKIFGVPVPIMGTFEEINLRFYVIRKEPDGTTKRGVVFINETVPNAVVAWVANKLYKEHYTAIPTKHVWDINSKSKTIEYQWKVNKAWNSISVKADAQKKPMLDGSTEQFIFEHYFGYTKINDTTTEEYKVNHPSWQVNQVLEYSINCNFDKMYGNDFEFLNSQKPDSVMLAEGSEVSVDWERTRIKL